MDFMGNGSGGMGTMGYSALGLVLWLFVSNIGLISFSIVRNYKQSRRKAKRQQEYEKRFRDF